MGRDLANAYPRARAVFEEVDDVLGEALSKLMWEGPEDRLTLTENAQPALMTVSMAAMAALKHELGPDARMKPSFGAGHSLGEYSALAASGALSLADTARLLRIRGEAMQAAVPPGQGAMLALLGVDLDAAQALARDAAQGEVCQPANDNAPGQVVISGSAAAIARAEGLAKNYGVRRAVLLAVSAPFHCALMQPAAEKMAGALADITVHEPEWPVIANVTAKPVSAAGIKHSLAAQVTNMVRWRESLTYMAEAGVTSVIEVGAGRVLTGMARRIDKRLEGRACGTPEEIRSIIQWLEGMAQAVHHHDC
jgi:[acyl-carrier-protein] S-malonyltransferase